MIQTSPVNVWHAALPKASDTSSFEDFGESFVNSMNPVDKEIGNNFSGFIFFGVSNQTEIYEIVYNILFGIMKMVTQT